MPVYLTAAGAEWRDRVPHKKWIYTAPALGDSYYPVVLDLLDGAHWLGHSACLSIRSLVAPSWDDVQVLDAEHLERVLDEVDFEDSGHEHFVLSATAKLVTSDLDFGVVLREPNWHDRSSQRLIRFLLEAGLQGGFVVVVEYGELEGLLSHFPELSKATQLANRPQRQFNHDYCNPVIKLLSIAPHGVPISALERLGIYVKDSVLVCEVAAGEQVAYVPCAARRHIFRHLPIASRRQFNRSVFEAWDPSGWGYLRRARHAISGGDRECLVQNARFILAGAKDLSKEIGYKYITVLAGELARRRDPLADKVYVSGARLSKQLGRNRGSKLNYLRALRHSYDATAAAQALCELANFYATERASSSLTEAERLCTLGLRRCEILPPDTAFYYRVRFLNILALVNYHRAENEAALVTEKKAFDLIDTQRGVLDSTAEWARNLISLNTAKLLDRRFGDNQSAYEILLERVGTSRSPEIEDLVFELGRIYLARREFRSVITLLSDYLDQNHSSRIMGDKEVYGNLLLVVAHMALDERSLAESRIQKACSLVDRPREKRILALFEAMAVT